MEPAHNPPSIYCPLHPTQSIQRVDMSLQAKKQLYCSECILESDDSKSLMASLQTLDRLVSTASLFYSSTKQKVQARSDPPGEYLEMLSRQGECLDQLTKHINHEKKKIEDIFTELAAVVLKKINQEKQKCLQLLEDKVVNLSNQYLLLEKQIKTAYPREEEISSLFPSKEELQKKLAGTTNAAQLVGFVNSIKLDMVQDKGPNLNKESDENKRRFFDGFLQELKELEDERPVIELRDFNIYNLEAAINQSFENFLENTLVIRGSATSTPQSNMISPKEFGVLEEMLPAKYGFNLNLLYKGSRDGMNADAFHAKCDRMGPTVTIIKCKYQGFANSNLIGGFLDQDWDTSEKYASSNEAFIFSITNKVYCPIVKSQFAAKRSKHFGPSFGGIKDSHEIWISKNFQDCSSWEGSYANGLAIIDKNYKGSGTNFVMEDIEVYSVGKPKTYLFTKGK